MSRGKSSGKERGKRGRKIDGSDDSDEDFVVDEGEEEEDDDYEDDECEDADDNYDEEDCESSGSENSYNSNSETAIARRKKPGRTLSRRKIKRKKRKRGRISRYEEEDEDDEEFYPGSEYSSGEEENSVVLKRSSPNNKVTRLRRKKRRRSTISEHREKVRRRAVVESKKRKRRIRRNTASDDDFVVDDEKESRKKARLNHMRCRKISKQNRKLEDLSDLESSDPDFVISDEEIDMLEGVPDDNILESSSRRLKGCQHAGESGREVQERRILRLAYREDLTVCKGKQKLTDVYKQVCSICLSEERKGTIRGKLNCCDHFFCFVCIMEWSKMESRCPICKQRFESIDKLSISGIRLRNVSITVPCRNQVYQPSEEELRSYLDPYANILCIGCHQGGGDSLMLLCDICDSAAHTYCVGLGMEVPEGNWYCEGCKASEPASSNLQTVENIVPDQIAGNGLSLGHSASDEGSNSRILFDLNFEPGQPQGSDVLSRFPMCGGPGISSPAPGAGPSTVMGRRRLRRQIHTILTSNRMSQAPDLVAVNNRFVYPSFQGDAIKYEVKQDGQEKERFRILGHERPHMGLDENGRSRSYCSADDFDGSPSLQHLDNFSGVNLSLLRRHIMQIQVGATTSNLEFESTYSEQLKAVLPSQSICAEEIQDLEEQPRIGSNIDRNSPLVHDAKRRICSIVKRHLKSFVRDGYIDRFEFKDIAKQSTHNILAACGIRCSDKQATFVQAPSCGHNGDRFTVGNFINVCCSKCFNTFVHDVVQMIVREYVKEKD